MSSIDIFVSDRQHPSKLLDTIESIKWSCQGDDIRIFGVSINYDLESPTDDVNISSSYLPYKYEDSLHMMAKIQDLVEKEDLSDYVVLLNSNWLAIGLGLSKWVSTYFEKSSTDIIGVADHFSYETYYNATCQYLTDLNIPHAGWESPPLAVNSNLLILNRSSIEEFYSRGILVPQNYSKNPVPHGVFISWCAPMLGKSVLPWGSTNNPVVPVYCVPSRTPSQMHPSPSILSPFFVLYYPVNKIMGFSEFSIREYYKSKRQSQTK